MCNLKGGINGSKNSDKSGNALNSNSEKVSMVIRPSCLPTLLYFSGGIGLKIF